jgi:hypothetical protein
VSDENDESGLWISDEKRLCLMKSGEVTISNSHDRATLLEKIKELHADVEGSVLDCWRKNFPKMIQLGAELTALKDDVGYGQWLKWFRANEGYLGFGEDTAERYLRLYENRSLFEQTDSAHVRNLTDALILIKEPDPAKRKALLEESARTGKSIRTAKKRDRKGQKPLSDPKRTAATDGLTALGIEYEVAAQWVEVAQGETVEDLIKDALRLRALAREIPNDAPDVSKPETAGDTDKPKADEKPAAPPKVQEPNSGPESPADDQQPQNASDPADPAKPLVTVEQPENVHGITGPEWTEIKRLDAEIVTEDKERLELYAKIDQKRDEYDADMGFVRSRETWLQEIQRLLKRCRESVSKEDWEWIKSKI